MKRLVKRKRRTYQNPLTPEQIERVMELVREYGQSARRVGAAAAMEHRYTDEFVAVALSIEKQIEAALKGESTDG